MKVVVGCFLGSIMLTVVALIYLVVSILFFNVSSPKVGSHVEQVEWLPKSASDISYYLTDHFGWINVYECTMEEEDFMDFAKKEGWDMQEKKQTHLPYRHKLDLPSLHYDKGQEWHYDMVEDVLFYTNRKSGTGGGGKIVVYDPKRKRLFYVQAHR